MSCVCVTVNTQPGLKTSFPTFFWGGGVSYLDEAECSILFPYIYSETQGWGDRGTDIKGFRSLLTGRLNCSSLRGNLISIAFWLIFAPCRCSDHSVYSCSIFKVTVCLNTDWGTYVFPVTCATCWKNLSNTSPLSSAHLSLGRDCTVNAVWRCHRSTLGGGWWVFLKPSMMGVIYGDRKAVSRTAL